MQKKFWIIPGTISAALVVSLLALSNPKSAKPAAKPATCCKKMMKCNGQPEKAGPGQTSLDNLSNQFITFPLY